MPDPITDPALLAQLNGGVTAPPKAVVDPALLAQLNAAPSVVEDVAKSGGIGLAKGTVGLAGLPGDAKTLIGSGLSYLESKIGRDPEAIKKSDAAMQAAPSIFPTSGGIQSAIESKTGEFYKPKTTAGEYAQTVGEFAPGILGGPGGLVRRGLTQVVAPAVTSETAGQIAKGTAAEPYMRVAGALAAPLALAGARRAITPLPAAAERTNLANTLRGEGVDLTAGQATGRKPLQWAESAFGDMPGSGGRAARTMENQNEQFTNAALRRVGENADRATPTVVDNAFTRIGNDFETVGRRNVVVADPHLGHDLNTVRNEYNNLVGPTQRAPVVENTINDIGDIITQNGGHITGQQYNALTSRLARQARGANADPQLGEALRGTREALDDAMERSLRASGNTADLETLRTARNQYRNLMVVEKAATGAGSNAAEGLISPSQLRNAVVQQSRRSYARGQGDFADIARAGEAILKPLPQSGTAPRQNLQHVLALLGGAAGGAAGGFPGAAAGIVAPAMAGRALMSGPVQAYLGNQLLLPGQRDTAAQSIARALLASSPSRQLLLEGQ